MVDSQSALRFEESTRLRPFSARNALRASAMLTGVHAIVLIATPGLGRSMFGVAGSGDAGYWLRTSGVLCLALTVVFWWAAKWPASMMQRPVLWAAGMITATMSVIGLVAILDGTLQASIGLIVGIEAALAAWVGWLLVTDGI